ncbi:hypothetical protein ASPFODRAFT_616360 [Aspergillus luchuensis CBS 106.47]|uniref:Uncharacterized protein n=1 Tax=Aspergillus luchuensis (strain CBS 106.47) TaxID=1137211 RepID=A0A1M3TJN4_ASPLC|nr:hypothetical protein ASPFODRAFT_616360 [Aspergillus luchuensis CBS 106.47]
MAVVSFSMKMLGTIFSLFFLLFRFMFCLSLLETLGASEEGRGGRTREKENRGAGKIRGSKRRKKWKINGALTREEEDKGEKRKTSCHYLGRISSAQGFLTAEQREREREGGREGGRIGRSEGEGKENEERASSRRWSRRRRNTKGISLFGCSCCLLLLVAAGGEKGRERERERHARQNGTQKEKPATPRPLSRVRSGLVFFFLLFRESTPQGREKEGKQKRKIEIK